MFLIVFSYIADLIFGDPEWLSHPVRGMGKLISFFDSPPHQLGSNHYYNNWCGGKWIERLKGVILVIIVVGISGSLAYLFITIAGRLSLGFGSLAWIYLGYTALSVKDLRVKAKKVLKEVEKSSLVEARIQLSKIVGRDTHNLDKDKIVIAAIESVAENTNDGIVAPLFYLILGGPILAIVYKSINTLDSMVGYKNEKYLHFGWFSAKLDDVVNFIPARISGFLVAVASLITGKDFKESFRVMVRDGRKHSSPNSGVPEAAMAGALEIRLGGVSTYQGKTIKTPYLGEKKRSIQPSFIDEALAISLLVSFFMLLLGVLLKWIM